MGAVGVCCCSNVSCDNCASRPNDYTCGLSGIVNGTCSASAACTVLNTTVTLSVNVPCRWFGAPIEFLNCCGVPANFFECALSLVGTNYEFRINCGAITAINDYVLYTRPENSWTCLGTNVMVFATSHAGCSAWPASITMIPV